MPDGAYTYGVVPIGDDAEPGPAVDAGPGVDAGLSDASVGDVARSDATVSDAPVGDAPVACDVTAGPARSSCGVDDAHGVFVTPVSSGGSDLTGTGTRASPVASIGHALDLAKAAGKVVYVCVGSYAEAVVVDAAHDGARVFGGLDCTSWAYGSANHVVVAPPKPGFALEVRDLAIGTTLADVEFDAKDADLTHPGESSVAGFVHGSENVSLQRIALVAGKGTDGAPGMNAGGGGPTNWTTMSLQGTDATGSAAGAAVACVCPLDGSHSVGGRGGDPQHDAGSGAPAYDAAGAGAAGANGASCTSSGVGLEGQSAPAAPAGSPSNSIGSVSTSGWVPSPGASGAFGLPGQGGGGGGDGNASTEFGGGGAGGGCGGAGGGGGGGGGGSMALVIHDSVVSLSGCVLNAGAAGAGGPGGSGESGQPGGTLAGAGVGNGRAVGCPGAAGGAGSGGTGGQGGAGGASLGLAFSGSAPTLDGWPAMSVMTTSGITVSPTKASGGAKGRGGAASGVAAAGMDGPPGASGVSQAILGF